MFQNRSAELIKSFGLFTSSGRSFVGSRPFQFRSSLPGLSSACFPIPCCSRTSTVLPSVCQSPFWWYSLDVIDKCFGNCLLIEYDLWIMNPKTFLKSLVLFSILMIWLAFCYYSLTVKQVARLPDEWNSTKNTWILREKKKSCCTGNSTFFILSYTVYGINKHYA